MYSLFYYFLVINLLAIISLKAQNRTEAMSKDTTQNNNTTPLVQGASYISFKEKIYHFGRVKQGEKVRYSFQFINLGTQDLFLYEVQTSCGCTVTTWPRKAIKPQESSEVEIVFDTTNKLGMQNKVVLIISNAQNKEEKLTLTGEVILP
ncbi:MAG: DUF1573 domain-containing protein [Microscillaceae bacterium]|nr:DUF1573 domain-containing protein [Microscillaceae bacterium]MDW8459671.1 DUF1573 domain-containing protein [Cytophagales bacterium]